LLRLEVFGLWLGKVLAGFGAYGYRFQYGGLRFARFFRRR
jgi:hypothetical protein